MDQEQLIPQNGEASHVPLQNLDQLHPRPGSSPYLPSFQQHCDPQYHHHYDHHNYHNQNHHTSPNPHLLNSENWLSPTEDDAASFASYIRRTRASSNLNAEMNERSDRRSRKLVLCFDGTGNKFRGDDSDSNILKIFRMLDRTASDQYHYYQPGIGTYVVSGDLSHTSIKARINSWYMKAKDSAFGSSFDQHVVGGYRFLMRFYSPGDEIYIFGFSRGAYIARFLAEMLDYVGLLTHGNEEMVHFAWKAFSQWQCRRNDDSKKGIDKKKEMYTFMKGFRETFSRPVRRIQFLGLFDTVNSVPRFETAWMERSKFPYTARSSAKVVRHAVSIDERRAKFRQDLVYQSAGGGSKKHRDARQVLHDVHEKYRARRLSLQATMTSALLSSGNKHHFSHRHNNKCSQSCASGHEHANNGQNNGQYGEQNDDQPRGRNDMRISGHTQSGDDRDDAENPSPYRAHSRSLSRESHLCGDRTSYISQVEPSLMSNDDVEQDLTEVWFSGDHADVGGGWDITEGTKSASHVPLTWMVREAMRAGLTFDAERVVNMGCSDTLENQWAANFQGMPTQTLLAPPNPGQGMHSRQLSNHTVPDVTVALAPPILHPPNICINDEDQTLDRSVADLSPNGDSKDSGKTKGPCVSEHGLAVPASSDDIDDRPGTPRTQFRNMIFKAHIAPIHNSLEFGKGLGCTVVLSWKIMEYLPFRRMDLQADGSWKPIRWPLPRGEVRDVPDDILVHGSVIRRMKQDPDYRPGNLIIGGGGRGCRIAPARYGMGEWICIAEEGDPIGELWVRKARRD